jgi:hypothetical protein
MTLDRNPENYFAQIEQATFAPSNFVPGIAASPDKMLLARIFSYADAHRYRVGTNHAQLPVNAPHAPVHTYSKEGAMRYTFNDADAPVYAPNSVGGAHADPQACERPRQGVGARTEREHVPARRQCVLVGQQRGHRGGVPVAHAVPAAGEDLRDVRHDGFGCALRPGRGHQRHRGPAALAHPVVLPQIDIRDFGHVDAPDARRSLG